MDFIFEVSAVIKLFVVFLSIVFLIRLRLSLGNVLIIASVLLGVWCRLDLKDVLFSMTRSILAERTIMISILVSMILVLSHSMERTGHMQRLLESFKGIIGDVRLNITIFPALIGLLPMPGGAIFSAPMVDTISKHHGLTAEQKSLVNYWFRHIWEYWWPLYPGVILTCALSGIDLWIFIISQFPLSVLSFLAGYLFILRPIHPIVPEDSCPAVPSNPMIFLKELMPILMVILFSLIFRLLLALLKNTWSCFGFVPEEVSFIMALLLSIMWVWHYNKFQLNAGLGIIADKSLFNTVYMVVGIFVFQGILGDTQIISQISAYFAVGYIPVVVGFVALPFLVGWVTGISIAFVGTAFPFLISFLQSSELSNLMLPYVVLGFCSGLLGVLLSPLHFCLILTYEYFGANLVGIYKKLCQPCSVVMAGGVLLFLGIRQLLM